jgi:hypothetical protein
MFYFKVIMPRNIHRLPWDKMETLQDENKVTFKRYSAKINENWIGKKMPVSGKISIDQEGKTLMVDFYPHNNTLLDHID